MVETRKVLYRLGQLNACRTHLWRSNGRLASISTPLFCPNKFKWRPRLAVAGSSFNEVVLLNCNERFCRKDAAKIKCMRTPLWIWWMCGEWIRYLLIGCHADWTYRVWDPVDPDLLWLLPWWPNRGPAGLVSVASVLAYRTEDHPSQQTLHFLMCIASVMCRME